GTNSSGKSSILQALLLLKQTVNQREMINLGGGEQDLVDLGSYQELVFEHENQRQIQIQLEWLPLSEEFYPPVDKIAYMVSWRRTKTRIIVDKFRYNAFPRGILSDPELRIEPKLFLEAKWSRQNRYKLEVPSARERHGMPSNGAPSEYSGRQLIGSL